MSSSDPHTGGTLEQMAAKGTRVPNDAGLQNTIPSKPNPSDLRSATTSHAGDPNPLGSHPTAQAAGGLADVPRSARDAAPAGEVATGTGDSVPAAVETKRLDPGDERFRAKGAHGHPREARVEQHVNAFEGGQGAEAQAAPGEEGDAQDAIRERKGL